MILGIGTDITDIERIERAATKYGSRFLDRIFTNEEQEYCESFKKGKFQHYTARFSAKEAFSKAIGTGLTEGFKFTEICILNEPNGKPYVVLSGSMKEKWGNNKIHISLSHTNTTALSVIIIETVAV